MSLVVYSCEETCPLGNNVSAAANIVVHKPPQQTQSMHNTKSDLNEQNTTYCSLFREEVMLRLLSIVAIAAFSLSLTGCMDSGPNAEDIQVLWGKRFGEASRFLGRQQQVIDVSNINCSETEGKPGYLCQFDFATDKGFKNSTEARFVKQGDNWSIN
ncbi:MAG: hypothetical protein HWE34_11875 [Methylocystaceae bacterium]|nr:hypothetical protein [Methylocystaceae bacterium]